MPALDYQSEVAEGMALEVVAKLREARAPYSPGGEQVTDEEYEEALETARESARQAHHLVLIDRVTTQISHRGIRVALNHHIIYQVRSFVGIRSRGQDKTRQTDQVRRVELSDNPAVKAKV